MSNLGSRVSFKFCVPSRAQQLSLNYLCCNSCLDLPNPVFPVSRCKSKDQESLLGPFSLIISQSLSTKAITRTLSRFPNTESIVPQSHLYTIHYPYFCLPVIPPIRVSSVFHFKHFILLSTYFPITLSPPCLSPTYHSLKN